MTLKQSWVSLSLLSLTLFGCTNDSPQPLRDKGFIYCGQATPLTLNPQQSKGGLTTDTLSAQMFNRLIGLDPINHRPIAELATAWQHNENGLEYTFTLRKNVPFQDNVYFTPTRFMTAEDVVFSFERVIKRTHPYHAANHRQFPWFDSLGLSNLIQSVTALNDHQVKFVLRHSNSTFLANLASPYAVIHSAEYANQALQKGQLNQIDEYPIGTGPFKLVQFDPQNKIRLQRHSTHWQGKPKMTQVVFDLSQQGVGDLAKLITNECDVFSTPLASQLPMLKNHPELTLNTQTGMNVSYLAFNLMQPEMHSVVLREALDLAIQREKILQSVHFNQGAIAQSLLPPNSWAHSPTQKKYDIKKAKQRLQQSRYPLNRPITLAVSKQARPYNPNPQKMAKLIQDDLQQIGLTVHIVYFDGLIPPSQLIRDITLSGWIADNADPDTFLRPILSCQSKEGGLNQTNGCDSSFDELLDLALRTPNQEKRQYYYQQAQDDLAKKRPILPLTHGTHYQIFHPSLKGLQLTAFGYRPFTHVERKQESQ